MKKNGIFISFMVFLLVAAGVLLYEAATAVDSRQEQSSLREAAFNSVNNAFNNYFEETVSLKKSGLAKDAQLRLMPFKYTLEKKSLALSQRVPARESALNSYIDALNIYSIFADNRGTSAGLEVETSALQNKNWDSGAQYFPDLDYHVVPQCLLYRVSSQPVMQFEELSDPDEGCSPGFDHSDLERLDVTITLNSTECGPASSIAGTITGNAPGAIALEITINEISTFCPGEPGNNNCHITGEADGTKVISTHFDYDEALPDNLTIKCGDEDWLTVEVGDQEPGGTSPLKIENSIPAKAVQSEAKFTFGEDIRDFYFTSFSINVEKKNFQIKRST